MESNTPVFTAQKAPEVANVINDTLKNGPSKAVEKGVTAIAACLESMPEATTISQFGGEFPRRPESVVDTIVADAQAVYREAENAHKEAIQRGDYRQEKAAAMLATIFRNNELLISNFAEILEHYPDIADQVAKLSPTLMALMKEKNRYEENSNVTGAGHDASNDEKYAVGANTV